MTSNTVWVGEWGDMVSFDHITERLLFEFPDAPDEMISYMVVEAARYILRKTSQLKLQRELPVFCGVLDYQVPIPDCLDLLEVVRISDGSRDLKFLVDLNAEQVQLPQVSHDRVLEIEFIAQVKSGACELPRRLVEVYPEAVIAGARARIYEMASLPYHNVELVKVYNRQVKEAINDIQVDTTYKGKVGALTADFGRFI